MPLTSLIHIIIFALPPLSHLVRSSCARCSSHTDNSQNVTTSSDVSADYQSKPVSQGSTPLQTQMLSNSDSLTALNTDTLSTTGYNQRQNSSVTPSPASANTLANASAGKYDVLAPLHLIILLTVHSNENGSNCFAVLIILLRIPRKRTQLSNN